MKTTPTPGLLVAVVAITSEEKFTPPSESPTRAVIGIGGMGMGHVKSINTACKLLAVCDVDEQHLQEAVKASGSDARGYKDFREVLARKVVQRLQQV